MKLSFVLSIFISGVSAATNNIRSSHQRKIAQTSAPMACSYDADLMVFRYNGGDCSQSINPQPATQFQCVDFGDGPPTLPGETSRIVVQEASAGVPEVYFDGVAEVGKLFLAYSDNGIHSSADVTIYDPSNTYAVQMMQVNLECDAHNVFTGDRYGSIQLVNFGNITVVPF